MLCNSNEEKLPMLFIPSVEQSIPNKGLFAKEYAVYIHIPFCAGKCYFCSIPTTQIFNKMLVEVYLDALFLEMKKWEHLLSGSVITGVHIGGGTPSILSVMQIKKLFDNILERFGKEIPEITFEANPASLTKDKIDVLAEYSNVTLNIGIQSFNPERLKEINRYNNIDKIKDCIRYACGKKNLHVGIDLIVGLPGAIVDDCDSAINNIKELNIKNVFIYPYRLEANSFLFYSEHENSSCAYDNLIKHMEYIESKMNSLGFENRTIYYWTKESEPKYLYAMHQMKGKEWIGIGAGAYSYIDKSVVYNEVSVQKYVSNHEKNSDGYMLWQNVSSQLIWDMTFMIKRNVFDTERISLTYGKIAERYLKKLVEKLLEKDYCQIMMDKIGLTIKGKVLLDDVEAIVQEVVLN